MDNVVAVAIELMMANIVLAGLILVFIGYVSEGYNLGVVAMRGADPGAAEQRLRNGIKWTYGGLIFFVVSISLCLVVIAIGLLSSSSELMIILLLAMLTLLLGLIAATIGAYRICIKRP
jgi:hypothetical protein